MPDADARVEACGMQGEGGLGFQERVEVVEQGVCWDAPQPAGGNFPLRAGEQEFAVVVDMDETDADVAHPADGFERDVAGVPEDEYSPATSTTPKQRALHPTEPAATQTPGASS